MLQLHPECAKIWKQMRDPNLVHLKGPAFVLQLANDLRIACDAVEAKGTVPLDQHARQLAIFLLEAATPPAATCPGSKKAKRASYSAPRLDISCRLGGKMWSLGNSPRREDQIMHSTLLHTQTVGVSNANTLMGILDGSIQARGVMFHVHHLLPFS